MGRAIYPPPKKGVDESPPVRKSIKRNFLRKAETDPRSRSAIVGKSQKTLTLVAGFFTFLNRYFPVD